MKYLIRYLFLLLSFCSASVAYAAPDFADMGSLEQGFLNFVTSLSAAVSSAISSAAVQSDVTLLWTFFALLLVIWGERRKRKKLYAKLNALRTAIDAGQSFTV